MTLYVVHGLTVICPLREPAAASTTRRTADGRRHRRRHHRSSVDGDSTCTSGPAREGMVPAAEYVAGSVVPTHVAAAAGLASESRMTGRRPGHCARRRSLLQQRSTVERARRPISLRHHRRHAGALVLRIHVCGLQSSRDAVPSRILARFSRSSTRGTTPQGAQCATPRECWRNLRHGAPAADPVPFLGVTDAPGLIERIEARDAVVAIVGLGYVGLPLAMAVRAAPGFRTIGLDVDDAPGRRAPRPGRSHIDDVPDAIARRGLPTTVRADDRSRDASREADAIYLCVPTPFDATKTPVLDYVRAAATTVGGELARPGSS